MSLHFNRAVDHLKKRILGLGAVVEEAVYNAVKAIETRDARLAIEVIKGDERVDTLEVEVEEECLKILALHQPVATDLRFVVSVFKINSDLERIGDLAVNIAHRAKALCDLPVPDSVLIDFGDLAAKVHRMLHNSLAALVNLDGKLAESILAADDEVDSMNRDVHIRVNDLLRTNTKDVDRLTLFLSISRNLERIADHATNIAEDVIYTIEGRIVRHKKPFTGS